MNENVVRGSNGKIKVRPSKYQLFVFTFSLLASLLFIFGMAIKNAEDKDEKSIPISKDITLLYANIIPDSTGQKLAGYLKSEAGLIESDRNVQFVLDKSDSQYILKVLLKNIDQLSDTALLSFYSRLEWNLNISSVLPKPLIMKYTDRNNPDVVSIPLLHEKSIPDYPGVKAMIEKHIGLLQTLYYSPQIPVGDIDKLEEAILNQKEFFPENQELTVLFYQDEGVYRLKLFENRDRIFSSHYNLRMKNTVEYLQSLGLNKEIRLILVDKYQFYEREVPI